LPHGCFNSGFISDSLAENCEITYDLTKNSNKYGRANVETAYRVKFEAWWRVKKGLSRFGLTPLARA
jgi:hypothetical protein